MTRTSMTLADVATSLSDANHKRGDATLESSKPRIRVFMMDLWCYTPQYDRYLCESLKGESIEVKLGSVCPYQDPEYFVRNGLRNRPGLVDVVPKLRIRNDYVRRALMFIECCINMAALLVRFSLSRPDILHVQWIPMVRRVPFEIWFLKLLKKRGIKLVYTVHNVLPHDTGRKFESTFRRVYKEMDALVCHTDEAKRRLTHEFSVDPQRVWVIPHGPLLHDVNRSSVKSSKAALSLACDETLVLWQGIIRSYKGLDFLLEAWRKVDANNLKARLLIAGTGETVIVNAVKEHLARLGLQGSVRLDFRFIPDEELPVLYQASDIVVYPYREVTTSGALMTALAYQKAIVATNLPAFREALRDEETALLVEYGDVDALAASLRRLIRAPQERERLATRLASSDNIHSWGCIAKETRQCYASLLRDAQRETVSV
jgi:glycosyltransferase involved in cell wall biosynthesis